MEMNAEQFTQLIAGCVVVIAFGLAGILCAISSRKS